MEISYQFTMADGRRQHFAVDLLRGNQPRSGGALPSWTRLDYHQCSNCPLKTSDTPHCPAAADLAPAIGAFSKVISYERAMVTVQTPERTISKECQVQVALSSLAALIMATSGCPILGRMRGLALMHLPFATMEETLFRSVGAYLIKQLLTYKQGGQPDWELGGLKAHYGDLEVLNRAFRERIITAAVQDATLNAVAQLGMLSVGVGMLIDDQLSDLARFG